MESIYGAIHLVTASFALVPNPPEAEFFHNIILFAVLATSFESYQGENRFCSPRTASFAS